MQLFQSGSLFSMFLGYLWKTEAPQALIETPQTLMEGLRDRLNATLDNTPGEPGEKIAAVLESPETHTKRLMYQMTNGFNSDDKVASALELAWDFPKITDLETQHQRITDLQVLIRYLTDQLRNKQSDWYNPAGGGDRRILLNHALSLVFPKITDLETLQVFIKGWMKCLNNDSTVVAAMAKGTFLNIFVESSPEEQPALFMFAQEMMPKDIFDDFITRVRGFRLSPGNIKKKADILQKEMDEILRAHTNPVDAAENFITRFEEWTLFAQTVYLRDYIKKSPTIIDIAICATHASRDVKYFEKIVIFLKKKGVSIKEILLSNADKAETDPAWISIFMHSGFGKTFDYKPLIKICIENGVPPEKIKDDILSFVNSTDSEWLEEDAGKELEKFLDAISPSDEPLENKESAEVKEFLDLPQDGQVKSLDDDEDPDLNQKRAPFKSK